MTRMLTAAAVALVMHAPQARFRSAIDLVEVDTSVMRGGTAVAGLTSANFTITDNGVSQVVTSATLSQMPLNVLFVLDVSGSVAGEKLAHLIDAGQALLRNLRDEDRTALVTFSQAVRVDVPLTRDRSLVRHALTALQGDGATSLNDAIHVALQLRPIDTTRSVVILFTDGFDTASWVPPAALEDEARRIGVVIHAIELRDELESPRPRSKQPVVSRPLRAFANASGGRVWSATSSRDLRILFSQALEEMRARYVLTFTPTGVPKEGWHQLKVSLKDARGDVTARPAYFVAPKER